MEIKDIFAECEQNEEFGLFQETVFRILQNRGHFLKDVSMNDLTDEAKNTLYIISHEMWSHIVHFKIDKTSGKKVIQLDKRNGNLIAVYDSIAEAARAVKGKASSISRVCLGLRNSTRGYNWRYATDGDDI